MDNLTSPTRRDVFTRPPEWRTRLSHLSMVELRLAQYRLDCEEFAPRVRGILIGENPGPNSSHELPMFPWPHDSSAGLLMTMSDLTPGEYLGGLYRRNLCDYVRFRRSIAKHRAREIISALFDLSRDLRVVLCGAKVAEAFNIRRGDYFWKPLRLDSRQTAVVIPHPSGKNYVYHEAEARRQTREWMRWAVLGEAQPTRQERK